LRGYPDLDKLVSQGLELGEHTHISQQVYIDNLHPWLIRIEDYVTLGPMSSIITHDASLANYTAQTRLGRVVIRKRAYVGVGAILLPGTTIGEDSVVGAGAVVHGVVPPNSLVMGNPAKATPIRGAVAWHQATARRAPSWPSKGWTLATAISEERKQAQREALEADGAFGFVPGGGAPDSPLDRSKPRPPAEASAQ
jgi:carbonic anhydrase/acetyltransferase-like protein (isoleucine patch superfamily)